jgi:hypothetical protein
VAALQAGLVAPVQQPTGVAVGKLAALLAQGPHHAGASAVAAKYSGFTPGDQAARMIDAMDGALARAA